MKTGTAVKVDAAGAAEGCSAGADSLLKREWLGVFAVAAVLYGATCAPGVLWQDSGLFTYRVLHNDLVGNLGLALSHPLYVLVALGVKLVPWGDLAHKVNLVSSFFGAVTIANVYVLAVLITRSKGAALFAAATLGLSWTFWQHSTIAEDYTMYAATLTVELIFLVQYFRRGKIGWLYALALMNGLSLSNHMWATLPLACYVVLLVVLLRRKEVRWGQVVVMAAWWTLGASLYLALIVIEAVDRGSLASALVSAAFGDGWQGSVLNTSVSLRKIMENFIFIGLNYPSASAAVLIAGLAAGRRYVRGEVFWTVLGMMGLFVAFAFRYHVPDRHAFFLPVYVVGSVFVSLGAVWVAQRWRGRWLVGAAVIFALLPVGVYAAAPTIARHAYPALGERRQLPYRDDYKYWLQPWQTGNFGGERFAREALEQVEEGAMIFADTTTVHALLYMQQVYGVRPDVMVVSTYDSGPNTIDLNENTAGEIVERYGLWVVTAKPGYCPGFILDRFDTVREGMLYRVVGENGDETAD